MSAGRRVAILGVGVDPVTEDQVLDFIGERVQQRRPGQIVTVNAEFIMKARADAGFAEVLAGADLATPDGAGVVWAMRRQGVRVPARVGGSDLIWSVARQAAALGHRLFLLGGESGVAEEAARRLCQAHPGLEVAGTYAGSSAPHEAESIVDLIRCSRADVLFVAFGAPHQDVWLARYLARSGAAVGIGVGGSFDYLAGRARRAPRVMREHGLEWLWRLLQQPWRWRRMLALPHFAWLVWTAADAVPSKERT